MAVGCRIPPAGTYMKHHTPDIDAHHVYGGRLEDIPLPHIRLYPTLAKRPVEIHIHKYYGIGKHYFPTIEEENNPLWDSSEGVWRQAWDDKESKGREFSSRFNYLYQAKNWVKKIIETEFQGEGLWDIKIGYENLLEAERTKWFGYLKEGD